MLTLFSAAYASVARARRRWYERHPERQRQLQRPVVSVGNIAVGGSGKTPAVAHIARLLIAAGERPAILSRGYRRQEPTEGVLVVSDGHRLLADLRRGGDEPLMLARAVPGAAVFVGADRHLSGRLAETRFACTVHLLDDGFQHVRLRRDIDIVLVSPDDLQDRVLPAGRLREEPAVLRRAAAVVLNGSAERDVQALRRYAPTAALFEAHSKMSKMGSGAFSQILPSANVLAVAGIARPERFFRMLAADQLPVVRQMTFPDHHWYTGADVQAIARAARESGAGVVVTTEKDFVRLLPFRPFPVRVVAMPLEYSIEPIVSAASDAISFGDWLLAGLAAARSVRGPSATADIGLRTSDVGPRGSASSPRPEPVERRTSDDHPHRERA